MWLTVVPAGGHHWVVVWAVFAAVAAAAYACGCFNGSVIVSKYILKDDVRTHGSGNAGLTNFHRTFGGKLTGVVLGLDVVKMVVAVAVAAVAIVMVKRKKNQMQNLFLKSLQMEKNH